MEPHSYECGNREAAAPLVKDPKCFNGAALLRVRKLLMTRPIATDTVGFNGAALLRVRKSLIFL